MAELMKVKVELSADDFRRYYSGAIGIIIETLERTRDKFMNMTNEEIEKAVSEYAERQANEEDAEETL